MLDRTNGSALADPTPILVQLAAGKPGVPPLQIQVWPDWRGAPNDGARLTSVLVLGLVAAHQQIAVLAGQVAALAILVDETDVRTDDGTRIQLARHNVAQLAAQCSIAAPQGSALDGIPVGETAAS